MVMQRVIPAILIALAALTWAADVTAQDKAQAHERFDKGVNLFKEEDFEGALVEFMSAYQAAPHFAVHYNIGICLYKLHRYPEAQEEIQLYLEEGGDEVDPAKKKEVEKILVELENLVGQLVVTCDVAGAQLYVDGEPAGTFPLDGPLRLKVGEYKLRIEAEGYRTWSDKIMLPGGTSESIDVWLTALPEEVEPPPPKPEPEQPPPPPAPSSKKKIPAGVFWAGASLTVALAAGAAVTGVLALKKEDEYASMTWEDEGWLGVRNDAKTLQLVTNVLWGVTGGVGLATFIMAFFTRFKSEKNESAALTLLPDPARCGLTLTGVF